MTTPRPNIVFVFADEYRQHAVGCMNADPVLTPNLDRFASQSVLFTHAISNRPVCSPYRAMLFTGKYPHANHVLTNCNSRTEPMGNYLRASERCLSDVLHDAGYCQGYIGKLHLDPPSAEVQYTEGARGNGVVWDSYTPPGPRRHGFDFWHAYGCCDWHFDPHYWHGDAPIDRRTEPKEWSVKHETDVAVDYIRNEGGCCRDPDRPFHLMVSYNPPHMPFHQVPERYLAMYGGLDANDLLTRPNVMLEGQGAQAARHVKNYFAAVTGVDDQFGRILDALRDTGLADNTIVIFTADHGEMMGSHGLMHKTWWYDESFLVPFIMRWPAHLDPRRDDLLLSVPDIMPTLLDMAGLADHIPDGVQGTSLAAAILANNGPRPSSALYLDVDCADPAGGRRGVRTHRWMFVEDRHDEEPHIHLFDCRNDPWQRHDVAGRHPDVIRELRRDLHRWLNHTGDPWPRTGE